MSKAPETHREVTIGAEQAVAQLAIGLRPRNFSGEIIIVSDEPQLLYQRSLSKGLLSERSRSEGVFLRFTSFWHDVCIEMMIGVKAGAIDPRGRLISFSDDRYDHLETIGSRELKRLAVVYWRESRLIMVDAINKPRAHTTARRRIADAASEVPEIAGAA